jgi:hypothetical protein
MKECKRKGLWSHSKYNPGKCRKDLEENTENLRQYNQCSGHETKCTYHKYR